MQIKTSPTGNSIDDVAVAIATGLGLGRIAIAPGTWASLAALPIAWQLGTWFSWHVILTSSIVLFCIGIWAADRAISRLGPDAPAIVIDEISGQLLTLSVAPVDPVAYLLGFFLFRLFDIAKPWPVSWADSAVPGGLGVMLDDLFAGVLAAASLAAILAATGNSLLGLI